LTGATSDEVVTAVERALGGADPDLRVECR
jgi:hypothetical protein